jgi:hypothetical protein
VLVPLLGQHPRNERGTRQHDDDLTLAEIARVPVETMRDDFAVFQGNEVAQGVDIL